MDDSDTVKVSNEEEYLLISGIQHFIFCRRQWALIHIERLWEENFFTLDGQIKHEKVDEGAYETKNDKKILRSLSIVSHKLRIQGKCDVVELKPDPEGFYFSKYKEKYSVYPVEYKRGKPKKDESDKMQLLAEAMCLEEMLGVRIEEGACFYFETRRRESFVFTAEMRDRLIKMIEEMNQYYDRKYTPQVKKSHKCKSCSLKNLCLPEISEAGSVSKYMEKRIQNETIT